MERLTYTVSEAAALLGLSRSKTYELVAQGLIPVIALGTRRKLIPRHALERLVHGSASALPHHPDSPQDRTV